MEKPLSKFGQFLYNICDHWGQFLVRHMWLFWVLSFTWSIITTIMGLLVSLVLIICGKRPQKFLGGVWYFEVGKSGWGGLEMGICFLQSPGSGERTSRHEFGHLVAQTTLFGPFMLIVMAASAARYWWREIFYYRPHKTPPRAYDDVWFERSATQTGGRCVDLFKEADQDKKQDQ